MAYQPNIPQPTDELADSQADILANFQAIKALIDVNHVTFDAVGQGYHKYVTFPVQSLAPVFAAGDNGLYNFLNATTNKNELYVRKQTFTGTANIPATASSLGQVTPTDDSAGWTYLPSGQIIIWGTVAGTGPATFTIPGTCPTITAIQSVQATVKGVMGDDNGTVVRIVSMNNPNVLFFFYSPVTFAAAKGTALVWIIAA